VRCQWSKGDSLLPAQLEQLHPSPPLVDEQRVRAVWLAVVGRLSTLSGGELVESSRDLDAVQHVSNASKPHAANLRWQAGLDLIMV